MFKSSLGRQGIYARCNVASNDFDRPWVKSAGFNEKVTEGMVRCFVKVGLLRDRLGYFQLYPPQHPSCYTKWVGTLVQDAMVPTYVDECEKFHFNELFDELEFVTTMPDNPDADTPVVISDSEHVDGSDLAADNEPSAAAAVPALGPLPAPVAPSLSPSPSPSATAATAAAPATVPAVAFSNTGIIVGSVNIHVTGVPLATLQQPGPPPLRRQQPRRDAPVPGRYAE